MTLLHILVLIGCSIVGNALRELAAINKRAKGTRFSWSYYWQNNQTIILWNFLGMIALLACSSGIFYLEGVALARLGVSDVKTVLPYCIAPTGIIIGYGGGLLVRKLLKKGAEKAGLEDVYNQIEVSTEVNSEQVKTTTTVTTPASTNPTGNGNDVQREG